MAALAHSSGVSSIKLDATDPTTERALLSLGPTRGALIEMSSRGLSVLPIVCLANAAFIDHEMMSKFQTRNL
ncbi:hypothetical protein CEJ86_24465 [Sinorhizobium meliloti]|uniref:Uncharacterized protein n=1 Tax=Rhizobium meliloti TaxID=382 RepID=A0A2J0YWU3_RHIML|nr:hypothetical protein CEJ86_24465 [Sinorhizobium meliloti]